MNAPLKAVASRRRRSKPRCGASAATRAPPRACSRLRRRRKKTARSPPWRRRSAPRAPAILAANAEDVAEAKSAGATAAFLDRLTLDAKRVEAMAAGVDVVRKLKDPVGTVMASWRRPNGMRIERVRVPLGVVGVIYESRPNVTADAGVLCLKAGNAVILRGGSDSFRSSQAHPRRAGRGPGRSRPAGGRHRAGADPRSRRRGHDARRPRRRDRRDRAARRQEPGRARAGRGARAGVRASRRRLPRLCRRRRHSPWPSRSCSMPRCAAPACAGRPRPCWSTAPARRNAQAADRHADRCRLRGARR